MNIFDSVVREIETNCKLDRKVDKFVKEDEKWNDKVERQPNVSGRDVR